MRVFVALYALCVLGFCQNSDPPPVDVSLDLSNGDGVNPKTSRLVINGIEYFTCEERIGFIIKSVKDGSQHLWDAGPAETFLDLWKFSKKGHRTILELRYDAQWEVITRYFKHESAPSHKDPWTRITQREFEERLDDMKGMSYEPMNKMSVPLNLSAVDHEMIEIVENTSAGVSYKTLAPKANSIITAVLDSNNTLWTSENIRHVCMYARQSSKNGETILSIYTKNRMIPQLEHFEMVNNDWKKISAENFERRNSKMKNREAIPPARHIFFPFLKGRRCCRRGWITCNHLDERDQLLYFKSDGYFKGGSPPRSI